MRIRDDLPRGGMEYFLSGAQWVNLFEDFDRELDRFIEKIKEDLGLKEDFTDNLDSRNIKNFSIQHFKKWAIRSLQMY